VAIAASAASRRRDENRERQEHREAQRKAAEAGARIGGADRRIERDPGAGRGVLRVDHELEADHREQSGDRQDDEAAQPWRKLPEAHAALHEEVSIGRPTRSVGQRPDDRLRRNIREQELGRGPGRDLATSRPARSPRPASRHTIGTPTPMRASSRAIT
jgi:hypothetical protein